MDCHTQYKPVEWLAFHINMKVGKKIAEGAGHSIYEAQDDPNVVIKEPKGNRESFADMARHVAYSRRHFAQWLPPTKVEPVNGSSYQIIQERIRGCHHITPEDLERRSIRDSIKALFAANKESERKNGIGMDVIGLEGSVKCALALGKKYQNTGKDRWVITPVLRSLLWLKKKLPRLLVPNETLTWWQDPKTRPEITNIVIGQNAEGDDQVYFIDTSLFDTRSKSIREKVRSIILRRWNRFFLKKYFKLDL